ncbi:MAG: hypothetical protein RRA94_15435 [Bacteroidota bacterium]|nr:hypothetical protein [Bacteroidota bacterium]
MRRILLFPLLLLVLASCTDDPPAVSTDGSPVFVDMQYFPIVEGSGWEYRVDTTGNGTTRKGVAQILSTITGTRMVDDIEYAVQVNRIITGTGVGNDTLYVRKTGQGVLISSPGLLQLSSISLIPGLPVEDIPTEFLAVPAPDSFQTEWEIFDFEFNQIPLFSVFYRINGRYRGIESVETDQRTYRDCARVTISIEAQFPNPDNLLIPIRINESADFYYTRPHGLVVADGSSAIFTLLRGGLPLDLEYGSTRQEIIDFDIPQPR